MWGASDTDVERAKAEVMLDAKSQLTLCLRLRCSSPTSMPRGVEQLLKPPKDPDTLPSCTPQVMISAANSDSQARLRAVPTALRTAHASQMQDGHECPSPESCA